MKINKKMIDEITQEISLGADTLKKANDLVRAYNGNIDAIVKERISKRKSKRGKADMMEHYSPSNPFPRKVKKQAMLYAGNGENIERYFSKNADLFKWYIDNVRVNEALQSADELVCAVRACYIHLTFNKISRLPELVTIPLDRIWVKEYNEEDTLQPDVYVRIVKDLTLTEEEKKSYLSGVRYLMYSDESKVYVNCYKKNNGEFVNSFTKIEENEFGFVPYIYISNDKINLIPEINSEDYAILTQPTMIRTIQHVAMEKQGNPIRILKDVDMSKLSKDISPGAFLSLYGIGDKEPKFEEHASTLNIAETDDHFEKILQNYFLNNSIPLDSNTSVNKSGTALLVQETDIIEFRKRQIAMFSTAEIELFNKIAKYHNYLIKKHLKELNPEMPIDRFEDSYIVCRTKFKNPADVVKQERENKLKEVENTTDGVDE